jgi:hypothetical protein
MSDTIERMSETPQTGRAPYVGNSEFSHSPPVAWPMPHAAYRQPNRWLGICALAAGIVGIGLGAAALLQPMTRGTSPKAAAPSYTDQQVADAKSAICHVFSIVKDEVASKTSRPIPSGGDEIGAIAIGTNGRLGLYGCADYLLDQLTAQPATRTRRRRRSGRRRVHRRMSCACTPSTLAQLARVNAWHCRRDVGSPRQGRRGHGSDEKSIR